MCPLPEHGEIMHLVDPGRHEAVDGLMLSSAPWDLARTAAGVCMVHELDVGPTLKLVEEMERHQAAGDARAAAWVAAHQRDGRARGQRIDSRRCSYATGEADDEAHADPDVGRR